MINFRVKALLASVLSLGFAATPAPADEPTADSFVDALNGVFGVHPGARAVHAKGIVLKGSFAAAPGAADLSSAPHLQAGTPVPVTVRFSNFAGVPAIPDADGHASPRGMAIKFQLPDGSETDIVAHSYNGFPVATSAEFRDLLIAIGTSKPDTPKPTPLDKFLGDHPIAKTFLTSPKPNPESFATLPYFGVNAFKFTNAAGKVAIVRYQIRPKAGDHFISDADSKTKDANYLVDEIGQRIAAAPVAFDLVAQIADTSDKADDPSVAWPDSRRAVTLGTITLTQSAGNDAANKQLVFMPSALPTGIAAADPMIDVRSSVYAVSLSRRNP